jgi:tRNA(adenine34) deaminase
MSPESGSDNSENHSYYMGLALELAHEAGAQDEVPVGAIVVRQGQVVGRGYNRKEQAHSATRHAEIEAIEDASRNMGAWRLTDCDLYVTLEPCPMCAGAILQSRIRKLYFGTEDPKGGAVVSLYRLLEDVRWNHRTATEAGVLRDPCRIILQEFFLKKRI